MSAYWTEFSRVWDVGLYSLGLQSEFIFYRLHRAARERAKCCAKYVCLSVCVSENTRPNFAKCFLCVLPVAVALVFFWRLCVLPVFVDDVISLQSGLYGASYVFLSVVSVTAETNAPIPTKLCSKIGSSLHIVGYAPGAKFAVYDCVVDFVHLVVKPKI